MKFLALLGSIALITSSASAQNGFTGFSVVRSITAGGNTQYKIYGNWSTASSFTIVYAFDFNVAPGASGTMNARHQDAAETPAGEPGQSWSANYNLLGAVARDNDSWVTASGSSTSGGNDTTLDPSFTPSNSSYIPNTSGWYDSTPGAPNNVLAGGASHRMLVLQIVRSGTGADAYATSTFSMVTGYKVALTTTAQFGNGSFTIPAPGALALVGLVGAFGRRRRSSL